MITLLGSAFVTVARLRVALWVLPWRRLARSITIARNVTSTPSPERLEWAVRVASRAVPCATCLTQALALQRLLARYGYRSTVLVGVCSVDRRFLAHAWVEHEGQTFLGTSENLARYSRFFTWPASQLDRS
jgi:transglutaminase superfamily protein